MSTVLLWSRVVIPVPLGTQMASVRMGTGPRRESVRVPADAGFNPYVRTNCSYAWDGHRPCLGCQRVGQVHAKGRLGATARRCLPCTLLARAAHAAEAAAIAVRRACKRRGFAARST